MYKYLNTTTMPYEQFIATIKLYEHNRDSSNRYKKHKHLQGRACDRRRQFAVAILGKERILVDGHSRIAAVDAGVLTGLKLNDVFVSNYLVDSDESLLKLYKTFDNKEAVEKPADEIKTAQSFAGLDSLGNFALSIGAKSAVIMASNLKDADAATAYFAPTLHIIDSRFHAFPKAPAKQFPTAIKVAMLETVYTHGHKVLPIWGNYIEGKGAIYKMIEPITQMKGGASIVKAAKALTIQFIEGQLNE